MRDRFIWPIALIAAFSLAGLCQEETLPAGEFSGESSQAQPLPRGEAENISVAIRWVAGEYLSPESERIDRNYLAVESFDEAAGEDVRVEVWGLADWDILPLPGEEAQSNLSIRVFVHDRSAGKWWPYGPAQPEGNGSWVIHGVRFGEGAHQGQRFTLRAAVVKDLPGQRPLSAEEWQSRAVAVSDPVYLTVRRRLILPYPALPEVTEPAIWLSTIDHLTVSPTEPLVVAPVAAAAGTFEWPGGALNLSGSGNHSEAGTAPAEKPLIYLVIRSAAADRWRIFGPAVLNGVKWEIRDVNIADPGEPQWLRFQMSAIITRRALPGGSLPYRDWWEAKISASEAVEVSVKPHAPVIGLPSPEIRMHFIQTLGDTLSLLPEANAFAGEPLPIDSLGEVIQIGGEVTQLPQGGSVWVLVNPIGSPLWEVHGRAIALPDGGEWRLPFVAGERFRELNVSRFRLTALVSTQNLQPGLIDYAAWRANALAISDPVVVEEKHPLYREPSRLMLRITEVGGKNAGNPHTEADIRGNAAVEGEINRLPEGALIWVGVRSKGAENWHFSGPAFINQRRWDVPRAYFPFDSGNWEAGEARRGENPQEAFAKSAVYDLIAIAARGDLPAAALSDRELHWYALATSPVVQVRPVSPLSTSIIAGGFSNLLWIIILLALFAAMEYYFKTVSQVAEKLAEVLEQLSRYLGAQFAEMPKPQVIPSTFGVLILALGIFAIVGYFPIYTHVLERVLKLSPEKSESLALLLIVFIGLAGVIMHLSVEFISHREGQLINRIFDYFLNYALPVTVLLVTFSLWGVQALLYLELYLAQVEPGNIRIPAAMGAAAFFIAGIETLGFYWAARLGKDFLGWLLFHLFLLGPPAALAKIFRVICTLFRAFPHRGEKPAAQPGEPSPANPGKPD